MIKTIKALSRQEFNELINKMDINDTNVESFTNVAFISITMDDPKSIYNRPFKENHKNVLSLHFNDDDFSFTEKMGEDVIKFFEKNNDILYLYVHCDAGYSRSGAIAEVASNFYMQNYYEFKRNNLRIKPNNNVKRVLNKILREK